MPGGWQTVIDDFLEPKMHWKSILMDTIVSNSKNDYRLFPPNKKHIWRGFYLPSMRGEEINIMFGIDVSGSISDEEIHEGLSEVKGICDQFSDYTIYVRAFDTEIHNRWELHPFEPVPMVVTGRGGTDFEDICREAEKTPGISTLIIFSDLEAPFPAEVRSMPVIWLSVSAKKAPWGLTIQYPRKEAK
jgi:predicted metal-dependent peptidase